MQLITLPAPEDRGMVVFKLLPSLRYEVRMVAAFGLIIAGLVLQVLTGTFLAGGVVLAAGNLLLLVSGYDNRVDVGRFDASAAWERADLAKLDELAELDQKIRTWDRSLLDITNASGGLLFILLAGGLAAVAVLAEGLLRILALDGMVLFLPHWLTGVRSILVLPRLMVKVQTLRLALDSADKALRDHEVNLMILLRGGEARIPDDLKIKVDVRGHHEDFLGLYGQVVINEVQGSSYPYFYAVLVAQKGFGLRKAYETYRPPDRITKEFKRQGMVEVLVIRQTTTKGSGYHTEPHAVAAILTEGLALAIRTAVRE